MRAPADAQSLIDRAELAIAQGDNEEAIRLLAEAADLAPSSFVLVRLAARYRADRQLEAARSCYLQAFAQELTEGQPNPAVRTGLAYVFLDAGEPTAMIVNLLTQAESLLPDAEGLRIIAKAYEGLARREADPAYRQKAIELRDESERRTHLGSELRRTTQRMERLLRGHAADVRSALSSTSATTSPTLRRASGSPTAPSRVQYGRPG